MIKRAPSIATPRGKGAVFCAGLFLAPLAQAQTQVEGVNPADLLTQVQVTTEFNRLGDGVDQWTLVGKYDYRVAGTSLGLNFELPVYINLDGPGYTADGNGDLFARGRYINTVGQWSFGPAFEIVAPLGSDAFSSGRWQTNPAGLVVYAWNHFNITAGVHKRVFGYIEGDGDRSDINQYQWRLLQIRIWPSGWFAQADVAHWNDVLSDATWFDSRVSLGKQVSATTRMQVELKKLDGDLSNDFALSFSYALKL
jgi:hypothetical protein